MRRPLYPVVANGEFASWTLEQHQYRSDARMALSSITNDTTNRCEVFSKTCEEDSTINSYTEDSRSSCEHYHWSQNMKIQREGKESDLINDNWVDEATLQHMTIVRGSYYIEPIHCWRSDWQRNMQSSQRSLLLAEDDVDDGYDRQLEERHMTLYRSKYQWDNLQSQRLLGLGKEGHRPSTKTMDCRQVYSSNVKHYPSYYN